MTGIICINKPEGITSFGAVAKVRGITREKKAGHTGTLDPMATGVLPVMLGGATKFLDFLPESDKGYRASFILGKRTDTLDITGEIISENEVSVSDDEVEKALEKFRGKISQLPPMFSAKSVDGVRLYELARQGVEIDREPCEVEIKKLELLKKNGNEYIIDVLCSKGTYIRSLISDIGDELGCGAVMTSLCRTYASGFSLENCVSINELQNMKDCGKGFKKVLIPLENIFSQYEKTYVSAAQAKRFSNGGALDINRIKKAPEVMRLTAVYSDTDEFLGLGRNENGELKVIRLLSRRD